MTYTSDQQLAAMGLRRMEDAPRKEGSFFIGRFRNGEEHKLLVWDGGLVRFGHVATSDSSTHGLEALIGWKPA